MGIAAVLGSLLLAGLVGVGPVAGWLGLLNRRDRRARVLLQVVAGQLSAEALRSDITVDVRCGLLSRRATVRVDLRGAPAPHIWETATLLRRRLPGWVRLEVDGHVESPRAGSPAVRVTLESAGPELLRSVA